MRAIPARLCRIGGRKVSMSFVTASLRNAQARRFVVERVQLINRRTLYLETPRICSHDPALYAPIDMLVSTQVQGTC